jgi:hypothetical protein
VNVARIGPSSTVSSAAKREPCSTGIVPAHYTAEVRTHCGGVRTHGNQGQRRFKPSSTGICLAAWPSSAVDSFRCHVLLRLDSPNMRQHHTPASTGTTVTGDLLVSFTDDVDILTAAHHPSNGQTLTRERSTPYGCSPLTRFKRSVTVIPARR